MSLPGAIFVINDTVQEGHENVVVMLPEPVEGDHVLRAIYKLRPIVVSLTDASDTVHGTKIASALVDLGPQLEHRQITISKVQSPGGFSIGVALSEADGCQCRMLANNVMESLRYRFGELTAIGIVKNLEKIKLCIQQYITAIGVPDHHLSNARSVLREGLVSGIRPSLPVSKRLGSALSTLELCEASNDIAFTLLPRYCFPIGSCFFRKALCIHTNMTPTDTLDAARFCILHEILSRTDDDGLLVACKEVFSDSFEKRVISVVAIGHSAVCMLFHCSNDQAPEGHIDPYCVSEIRSFLLSFDIELSDQIDNEITRLGQLTASVSDLPSKAVSRQASNKEGTHQHAIIPPKPKSAPSSPKIRRKTSAPVSQESKKAVNKELAFAGIDTNILRFRMVDLHSKFITESPIASQDPLDIQIAVAFERAVSALKRKLSVPSSVPESNRNEDEPREVKQPIVRVRTQQESGDAANFRRLQAVHSQATKRAIIESAFHFQIKSEFEDVNVNAFKELGFFVVGRSFPPHHEVYLCVEDSTPSDIVNMAFQLVFAWT